VAEDHPVNQMVVRHMLETLGCNISLVANGKLALDALRSQRFDLVLMDVQMPVMDGLQATRLWRAKEEEPRTPILALTASVVGDVADACLAAGMDAHLSKPLRLSDLRAACERWASSHPERRDAALRAGPEVLG